MHSPCQCPKGRRFEAVVNAKAGGKCPIPSHRSRRKSFLAGNFRRPLRPTVSHSVFSRTGSNQFFFPGATTPSVQKPEHGPTIHVFGTEHRLRGLLTGPANCRIRGHFPDWKLPPNGSPLRENVRNCAFLRPLTERRRT